MGLDVFNLNDVLGVIGEKELEEQLKTFYIPANYKSGEQNDVEFFLHNKAIQFQKLGLSSTYLIYSKYKGENIIVGYFSIANKPLVIDEKISKKLSKNMRKKFNNLGKEIFYDFNPMKSSSIVVPAYLIGQIGRNFSEESKAAKALSGKELLGIAEEKISEAINILNGKFAWLECEDNIKLINFYKKHGYQLVEDYVSSNGLRLLLKKIA